MGVNRWTIKVICRQVTYVSGQYQYSEKRTSRITTSSTTKLTESFPTLDEIKLITREHLEQQIKEAEEICNTLHEKISKDSIIYTICIAQNLSGRSVQLGEALSLLKYVFGLKYQRRLNEIFDLLDPLTDIDFSKMVLERDLDAIDTIQKVKMRLEPLKAYKYEYLYLIEEANKHLRTDIMSLIDEYKESGENHKLISAYKQLLDFEAKKYNTFYISTDFYINFQDIIQNYFPEYSKFSIYDDDSDSEIFKEDTIKTAFGNGDHALESKKYDLAAHYYSIASLAGNLDARFNIGLMFHQGLFYKKNLRIAFDIFMDCAENGNPRGKYMVGRMYCSGDGIDKDEVTGFGWILASLSNGYSDESDWKKEQLQFVDSYLKLAGVSPKSIIFALDKISDEYLDLVKKTKLTLRSEPVAEALELKTMGLGVPIDLVEPYQFYNSLLHKLGAAIGINPQNLHTALKIELENDKTSLS